MKTQKNIYQDDVANAVREAVIARDAEWRGHMEDMIRYWPGI